MEKDNLNLTDTCYPCMYSPIYIPGITVHFLFAVPANGWVLWLMMTSASFLTDKMEVFEFNMVVNELLFCLITPVISIGLHLFKTIIDKYMLFFQVPVFMVRPLFQACICLERYLAVIHPVVFLRYKPLRYRLGCCFVVLLVTMAAAIFILFVCSMKAPVFMLVYTTLFCTLFLLNSFCCQSVLRALKRPGPGEGGREGGVSNQIKMRAFRTVMIIQATMVVSYVPVTVVNSLLNHPDKTMFCVAQPLTILISICSGSVQPFLYLHRAGKLPSFSSQWLIQH